MTLFPYRSPRFEDRHSTAFPTWANPDQPPQGTIEDALLEASWSSFLQMGVEKDVGRYLGCAL